MGKNTKSTKKVVILGESALSFYDASTGVFIARGDKKELSARQLNSPKIRKALHNGHLQYATDSSVDLEKYDEEAIAALKAKFEKMVGDGMEANKIAKAFTDEEVDKIAETYDLTRDKGEDSKTVIKSIIEQVFDTQKD